MVGLGVESWGFRELGFEGFGVLVEILLSPHFPTSPHPTPHTPHPHTPLPHLLNCVSKYSKRL
ncbi:hypothetical protein O53_3936 [Microcystis aeruginosa TAIHU98]|uniref:Uncharacterized protein n=1 Tax=Microcystis aeruginosa TAIHU98 TaxID=1134457 RepID=L7E8Y5_MICAE|nr:hypothetical protein O53_3936 [Microcystis aeruginosa TAIHU98]